jgi:hypothetical protein
MSISVANTKSNSLVDKAKAIVPQRTRRKANDEELELAVAWCRGEVGTRETQAVFKMKHSESFYYLIGRILISAVCDGRLQNNHKGAKRNG